MRVNSIGARHYSARRRPAYVAFLVHRLSGLALALFLPVHFWALGQALRDSPMVKTAEWTLVLLLAAHAGGGLRLLALEFLRWRDWQQSLLAVAAALTVVVGLAFALAL